MKDVNYFIDFFTAIPDEKWNIGSQHSQDGTSCALGLAGERQSDLGQLFMDSPVTIKEINSHNGYHVGDTMRHVTAVAAINNGETEEYRQPTPKRRILAALYDLKDRQVGDEAIKQVKEILKLELETI